MMPATPVSDASRPPAPARPRIVVLHASVPGRARLQVPGLYRDEGLGKRLADWAREAPGISHLQGNPLTGAVLMHYDRGHALADILARMEQALVSLLGEGPIRQREFSWRQAANPTLPTRPHRPAAPRPVAKRVRAADLTQARSTKLGMKLGTRRDTKPDTPQALAEPWHARPLMDVLGRLEVEPGQGLGGHEVAARQARYGSNALGTVEKRSALSILVGQFNSLPVMLLGASAVLSVATGGLADAVVILGVVALNAAIGYTTETQAERMIDALTALPRPPVPVLRDGRMQAVASADVVPGDLLLLTPGCMVAADAHLIHARDLSVDESALTGESLPVGKAHAALLAEDAPLAERLNMVYMGTAVTGGSALAVVVATGRGTELGLIQALVGETRPPETPMQRHLDRLGNQLVWISLAICGGVFAIGLLRGYGFLPMLRAAISLAVAAVPEGLPTVATTTLALGIRDMRRHRVLIRHLDAVETLGAVQVICLDKTGTLTVNRMSVLSLQLGAERLPVAEGRVYGAAGRVHPEQRPDLLRLLHVAALCNESRLNGKATGRLSLDGTATENALLSLALAAGVDVEALRQRHPLLRTEYRAEGRAYMSTWHAGDDGGRLLAVKGSPEQVLGLCGGYADRGELRAMTPEFRDAVRTGNERMAGEALRVLGFAYRLDLPGQWRDDLDGLVWVGLAGLADPIRAGTRELIAQFHQAGIKTVMITGDQSATAYAIGKQLDLSGTQELEILDSTRIDRLEPALLSALAQRVEIFSRVSPANKLQIVQGLQQAGLVVAMTGDGINDGPALKAADIGVAMGDGGTDVARSVADVVLEDDELRTMIVAVSRGRTIYGNIRKSIHYLVSSNMSEIGVTFLAVAGGLGQPLNTMQLLWINLLTDVLPALALAMEAPEPDVLQCPPRDPAIPILSGEDFKRYGLEAASLTAGALGAYGFGALRYGPGPQAGTLAFMALTYGQLIHALSCRSETHGVFGRGKLPGNPWLTYAVAGSAVLQTGTVLLPGLRGLLGNAPLAPVDALAVAAGAGLPFLANEALKQILPPSQGRK